MDENPLHGLACNVKRKPKLFWKCAKSRLKTRQSIPTLNNNGSNATLAKDKAEMLINFFTSVFTIEDLQNIPIASTIPLEKVLSTIVIMPETVLTKLN